MQFNPRDAIGSREIKGQYTVTLAARDKTSAAGNDMIELEMNIGPRRAWDWLGAWNVDKVKDAATACGLLDKFETGNLAARDFDGVTVDVVVGPDKKDPDKIAVKRYVAVDGQRAAAAESAQHEPGGDDFDLF